MLCEYGCNQEAKFLLHFKTCKDKWCCSKSYNSCPTNRKKNSESLNRIEVKEKLSNIRKEYLNREDVREKKSKAQKEVWKKNEVRERLIENLNKPEVKVKRRRSVKKAMEKLEVRQKCKESWNKNGRRDKVKIDMINGKAVYMLSKVKNPSGPQVKLYNIIRELYKDAILNYPLCISKGHWYALDIAVQSLKLDIEYDDTTYWHKGKDKKEHDRIRDEQVENKGWRIIRYKDYIPDLNQVLNDINKVLGF